MLQRENMSINNDDHCVVLWVDQQISRRLATINGWIGTASSRVRSFCGVLRLCV